MRRTPPIVVVLMLALATVIVARQQGPTFRTAVEVLTLDVSVLDQDRRPVRGLTQSDFTVVVDKEPRPVVAFKAVELPPVAPPPAPWIREVAADVVTNVRPAGRVVVVMIDDGSFNQADATATATTSGLAPVVDAVGLQKARAIARAAIDQLGPDDLGAVVFTENNHTAQSFTSDRARLMAAIDSAALFPGQSGLPNRPLDAPTPATQTLEVDRRARMGDPSGIGRGSCHCGVCSIEALERVAASLRPLQRQRKVVIYVSAGVAVSNLLLTPQNPLGPVDMTGGFDNMKSDCTSLQARALRATLREAQMANVTVLPVDPRGMAVGSVPGSPLLLRGGYLQAIAETTGGRAVVNNNDMEREVPTLFAENGSYYLLGVDPPAVPDDGKFHGVRVTVNRPGLEVRTRTGFYAPTAAERKAQAARPTRGIETTIEGALPKSDLPLEVGVTAFAESKDKAALAITLAVTQPVDAESRKIRRAESVEVIASAFDAETGKGVGSRRQKADVFLLPTEASERQFEVFSLLPVPPGRYEVRLGIRTTDGTTASVFTHAEVPDFASEPLSLSGLVLTSVPAPKSAPKDLFLDLMPVVPTAWRAFAKTDRVTAYMRVYQGGNAAIAPVPIATSITDARNQRVSHSAGTLSPPVFKGRSAEYRSQVPVDRLPPGEYLLAIDAAIGDKSARRTLRFTVRP